VQEEEQIGPPELEDGEILRKSSRKSDPLGKASGILGFTGLGLFLLTLLISFILSVCSKRRAFVAGIVFISLALLVFCGVFVGLYFNNIQSTQKVSLCIS